MKRSMNFDRSLALDPQLGKGIKALFGFSCKYFHFIITSFH